MFEESVKRGFKSSAIKYEELSEEWFEEYAKLNLRSTTYERLKQLRHRIYPAIGHLRIDKKTPRQLQAFVNSLKTKRSQRALKNSPYIMEMLKQLKAEHENEALRLGSKWIETDRLFVKWNGEEMNNQTPYGWLKEFCEKNDLPFYGIHCFRHFAASALISAGLDVTTVSGALGHSNSSTTLNVYSHMFQNAQARVSEAMDSAFGFLQNRS